MSREEIDRILNSDLTDIDHTVSSKINSIDSITGKLSEKSNFLAQFQMLLQQELKGRIPEVEKLQQSKREKEQEKGEEDNEEEWKEVVEERQVIERQIERDILRGEEEELSDRVERLIQEEKQSITDRNYCKLSLQHKLRRLLQDAKQSRDLATNIIEEIRQEFYFMQNNIMELTKYQFSECFALIAAQHQQKQAQSDKTIAQLKAQLAQSQKDNEQLRQELQQERNKRAQPLKQMTFHDLSYNIPTTAFNLTQKLKPADLKYENEVVSPRVQPNSVRKPSREDRRTARKEMNDSGYKKPEELYSYRDFQEIQPERSSQRDTTYQLPNIRVLTVGVPPVINGYGVLKAGSQVIYKGLWKNGKFDGKGKLTWESYCYEGDFQNGCFEGHGRLQIGSTVFLGKFKQHRAEGEGTLQQQSRRILGLWKENKLVREY